MTKVRRKNQKGGVGWSGLKGDVVGRRFLKREEKGGRSKKVEQGEMFGKGGSKRQWFADSLESLSYGGLNYPEQRKLQCKCTTVNSHMLKGCQGKELGSGKNQWMF